MNNNLTFQKTFAGSLKSNVNTQIWDTVVQQFESGEYARSIRNGINYINPAIEQKFSNADKTIYHIPHGSVIVEVNITADKFIVNAPFLNIADAKKVPILRQAAQINFSPLTTSRIELKDELLYFYYECPLEACEPYKIYDVLREICISSDNYDDEFISKFNAKHIQEPKIIPYTREEYDVIWNTIQQYIKEAFETYDLLENKRLNSYLWDIILITLLKIDYFCAPQGVLRNEIEKNINFLNSKEDYAQRLSAGKDFLKKLQTIDRSAFENDLYKIDVFVPYKFRTTLETVRNALKYAYETADKEMKAKDAVGATLTIEYGILNFLYMNNLEDDIANVFTTAMMNASGKSVQETATILYNALHLIMTTDNFNKINSSSEEQIPAANTSAKKGFFKKLFGI